MQLTSAQFNEIRNWHIGSGMLLMHTSTNEVRLVPVNFGRDGKVYANGRPIEEAFKDIQEKED